MRPLLLSWKWIQALRGQLGHLREGGFYLWTGPLRTTRSLSSKHLKDKKLGDRQKTKVKKERRKERNFILLEIKAILKDFVKKDNEKGLILQTGG